MLEQKNASEYCSVIGCQNKRVFVRALPLEKMHGLICAISVCKDHLNTK